MTNSAAFRAYGTLNDFAVAGEGLRIAASVQCAEAGVGFCELEIIWGSERLNCQRFVPTSARRDVSLAGLETIEIDEVFPFVFNPHHDWSDVRLNVWWENGQLTTLNTDALLETGGVLADLAFTEADKFYTRFQNPAFRSVPAVLQAYGAERAMKIAGADKNLWLSGAVVAIYRGIIDGVFAQERMNEVLEKWTLMQLEERPVATSIRLRWATSMHLAAGYAYLCSGNVEASIAEFIAMQDYWPRMATWPQTLTNFGIGRLMAALLLLRQGQVDVARQVLADSENCFPDGCRTLRIWNYSMFEELRAALGVWQYNFSLMKKLEGEKLQHIVPDEFCVSLANVSPTMEKLIQVGKVTDWICSGDEIARLLGEETSSKFM